MKSSDQGTAVTNVTDGVQIHIPTRFEQMREALAAYDHTNGDWRDYTLLPWFLLRWVFAWLWTQAWGRYRILQLPRGEWNRITCWMWGRWESPEPVMCPYCLWAGPERWLYHGYAACGDDDVEPMDYCPRCDNEMWW